MDLNAHYATVEKGIEMLGIKAADARGQKAGQWDFNRGSASIAVGLISNERFPKGYFYVTSILLDASKLQAEQSEDFFRTLMEINASLVNMQLCFNQNLVLLVSNRSAEGLDATEVAIAVNELSYYADELDDRLKEDFAL